MRHTLLRRIALRNRAVEADDIDPVGRHHDERELLSAALIASRCAGADRVVAAGVVGRSRVVGGGGESRGFRPSQTLRDAVSDWRSSTA